jgi:hypothetical protein
MAMIERLAFAATLFALPALGFAASLPQMDALPTTRQAPEIDWSAEAPIKLDVGLLGIMYSDPAMVSSAQVAGLAPEELVQAAAYWAQQRLKPAGTTGQARFSILRASIVAVPTGSASRLVARLIVRFELLREDQTSRGSVTIEESAARDVAGNADLASQQDELVADTMHKLDGAFQATLNQRLSQLSR